LAGAVKCKPTIQLTLIAKLPTKAVNRKSLQTTIKQKLDQTTCQTKHPNNLSDQIPTALSYS